MAFVYIVAVGRVRSQTGESRRSTSSNAWQYLCGVELLKQRLAACNLPVDAYSQFSGHVVGIAHVRPGTYFESVLTTFDVEERILWPWCKMASDVWTCAVTQAAAIQVPVEACCKSFADVGWQRSRGFTPLTGLCAATVLRSLFQEPGKAWLSGEQVSSSWGFAARDATQGLCLALPTPLALVVVHMQWQKLMFTASSTRQRTRLFAPVWPPSSFWTRHMAEAAGPKQLTAFDGPALSTQIHSAADDLRSWASAILNEAQEAGEAEDMVHQRLRKHVQFLEDLALSISGSGSADQSMMGTRKHSATQLVMQLQAAALLKNGSMLQSIVRKAICIATPAALAMSLLRMLNERNVILSGASIRRARFAFDCAFALHMRSEFQQLGPVRPCFIWADSSPQGGRDWLLIHMHYICASSLTQLSCGCDAFDALCNRAAMVRVEINSNDSESITSDVELAPDASQHDHGKPELVEDVGDASWDDSQVPQEQQTTSVAELTHRICSCISYHCCLPGAVGSKASSLPYKVGVLCHALHLETGSVHSLDAMLNSVVSCTTDLGTEAGIADIASAGFWSHFHELCKPQTLSSDVGEIPPELDEPLAAARDHLFQHALPVPGLLHIMDNLTKDIHEHALSSFETISKQLTVLTSLFCEEQHRERFVEKCLRQGDLAHWIRDFDRAFEQPIHWRWGSLITVLQWILELEAKIKHAWDPGKYGDDNARQHDKQEGTVFSKEAVTHVIRDNFFWAYLHMCSSLHLAIEQLMWWSENCPCHPNEAQPGESRIARSHREKTEFARLIAKMGSSWASIFNICPMKGKRAPEIACGMLQHRMANMFKSSELLVMQHVHGLSVPQQNQLMQEWNTAKDYLSAVLLTKIACWTTLPWKLCGIAHHDLTKARACAQECLSMYNAAPKPSLHHRMTNKFLDPDLALRNDMQKFADGATLHGLSNAFQWHRLCLKFIPVSERVIEGKHGLVSRFVAGQSRKKKRRSPVDISLSSGRLAEFEARVQLRPSVLTDVATLLELVRNPRQQLEVFRFREAGLAHSPELMSRRHHTQFERVAINFVYHCDATQQYRDAVALACQSAYQPRLSLDCFLSLGITG